MLAMERERLRENVKKYEIYLIARTCGLVLLDQDRRISKGSRLNKIEGI